MSYAALPLRAASRPPVNWGDPVTPARFLWLVSGRLYYDEFLQRNLPAVWSHLQAGGALTIQQFGLPGLLAVSLGLIVFFVPSRLYFLTLWIALVYTLFALQYEVTDSFVYLLPVYLAFSIWIGLGVGGSMYFLSGHWAQASWAIGALCIVYLTILALHNWPQVNASHDIAAELYGREVMTTAPARAILFAQGDETVFTLWYFHYALRERRDLIVIAADLLPFDWYRANLQYTYPELVLPSSTQDPWVSVVRQSNPGRPACYPDYLDTTLNCQ